MTVELKNARKILVTFLMHLGDLVLTTPFLHALRQAAPAAEITMLVDRKLVDVVRHNPHLNQVITIDKKGADDNLASLWRFSRRLAAERYDVLINLHPNERCSFIGAFCGAAYKAGATKGIFRPWFDRPLTLNRKLHAADMYLDVLTQLGVTPLVHAGLEMVTGAEDDAAAADFYRQAGLEPDDTLIGFNIGSAVETKRWPMENFALLADQLAAEKYKLVFFGGPMDEEFVAAAQAKMKLAQPLIATGKFTMGQLAAAIRRCRVFITNDSGPMHVAITQHVPVVALYGPSHPELYGPYTELATVVRAIPPCRGCAGGMKHTCPTMHCMKNITVEQVYEAAKKYLDGGSAI
ncbi:Hypothetical protein LUCI_4594 [Lucifera butyrica]|uniref:Uncharacterized protein n=1 Tax=Lucifera butyrica TaxID=1351585 RepID=A0A498RCN5_9FIRM|nr:glycosyltransferase family 9 protein [Lucifera butyrica]VBB09304.1 Hypothetical protein LUCI_4594 [Lucifera butyrica]